MKNFRTIIESEPSQSKITYHTPVLFLGSCFTENVGNKMTELKFPALVNPFGVLYNPASVRAGLEVLIDERDFNEGDINFFNEQWFSFYHDTTYSNTDKNSCLEKINTTVNLARKQLRRANCLVITFGTAWVYHYIKTRNIVSNCHKIPSREFERRKLSVEDIFVQWAKLLSRIEDFNPNIKVIFTVSPVRHWKDGAIQNQLSKSTLILAIHQLKKIFENVEYFPSYEIMMDDLRDYRFYNDDMLHPSKVAIDYIWKHFSQTYFEKETIDITKEVSKIIDAKNHRPINPNTDSHKTFLKTQIEIINKISQKYSFIDFKKEIKYFESGL